MPSSVLQNICCNDVDVPPGKVVYTQMLNERGGIEADITVTRWDEDKFFGKGKRAFFNHPR